MRLRVLKTSLGQLIRRRFAFAGVCMRREKCRMALRMGTFVFLPAASGSDGNPTSPPAASAIARQTCRLHPSSFPGFSCSSRYGIRLPLRLLRRRGAACALPCRPSAPDGGDPAPENNRILVPCRALFPFSSVLCLNIPSFLAHTVQFRTKCRFFCFNNIRTLRFLRKIWYSIPS